MFLIPTQFYGIIKGPKNNFEYEIFPETLERDKILYTGLPTKDTTFRARYLKENALSMKCPFYKMSYLWNVPSMKCPIYEMSYLWNVPCIKCPIYKMSQHLNFVLIINCSSVNNFSVVLKIDHIFTFLLRPIKFIQSEEKLLIVLTKRSVIQYLVQWNP